MAKERVIIRVALGIVVGEAGCLVAQRLDPGPFEGLWEFPGGKIEPGESSRQALKRELQEEIGIEPTQVDYITQILHDYKDRSVALDIWRVHAYEGTVQSCENQPLKWCPVASLSDIDLLPASREILPYL